MARSSLLFRLLCIMCALMLTTTGIDTSWPCNFHRIGDGVCVCNATYCDTLDLPQIVCGEYILVTSSKNGKRFDITRTKFDSLNATVASNRRFEIDESQKYQQLIGFGGALTDATSSALAAMNKTIRECVFRSYASKTIGAAYDIIRIPLGGSDFSEKPWAYHETPSGDETLSNMTDVHPLDRRRIDQIKEIQSLMPTTRLRLMLCAWSPPTWMKTNNRWIAGWLQKRFYSTWALYHIKVMNLWKNEGLQFWSLSTGNEPIIAPILSFISLAWFPKDLKRWLTNHLKPMLNENGYENVQILGVDDQRSTLMHTLRAFEKSAFDPHLDGLDMIGLHWYLDGVSDANLINTAIRRYKIPILYTESCEGAATNLSDMKRGPVLGSWKRCQEYVRNMIDNFSHGVSGFIDWNMVLNTQGGPNYVRNFADAPMIFDEQNQTLYKQPMFYGIAHFSAFLQSNCTRIGGNLSFISRVNVQALAFACANYTNVVILHNRSSSSEQISVIDKNGTQINLVLDAASVNTLVYQKC